MKRPLRLVPLLASLALYACSGGGSAPGTASAGALEVVIATDSGSDVHLSCVVDAAALEREDGTLTGDLLRGPRTVVFSDPAHIPSLVELFGVPPGSYRTLHLMVAPDSVRARMEDGSEERVAIPSPVLAIPLMATLPPYSPVPYITGDPWRVAHEARLQLRRDFRGVPNWNPNLAARSDRPLPLRHTHVTVTGENQPLSTMDALLQPHGGDIRVVLQFDRQTVVLDKPNRRLLTVGDLYNLVEVGTRLTVEGVMLADRTLEVTYAEVGEDPMAPGAQRLLGRVRTVDSVTQTLTMLPLSMLPVDPRVQALMQPPVTVDYSQARIILGGAPHCSGLIPALVPDALIEVQWRQQSGDVLLAEEIEIVDEVPEEFGETQGLVAAVRASEGVIVVEPRGNSPLLVGGVALSSAEIVVGNDTVLFRQRPRDRISISEVLVGERIRVHGHSANGNRVDACAVRVKRNGGH